MNRAQRRRQQRQGKPQGMTYGQQLARTQQIKTMARQAVEDRAVQIQVDMLTQINLLKMCIANNIAFGIGKGRIQKFLDAYQDVDSWFAKMVQEVDEEYAKEKLRLEFMRISGEDVQYLYEEQIRLARRAEEEIHTP